MSAAMSPPHLAPQRARAFINHSPESYREAIGARSASRGSPRQTQPQSQSHNQNQQNQQNQSGLRITPPAQLDSQAGTMVSPSVSPKPGSESEVSAANHSQDESSRIHNSHDAGHNASHNDTNGAEDSSSALNNSVTNGFTVARDVTLPLDARPRRSDTMPTQMPERPQSQPQPAPSQSHKSMSYQFGSSSGSESGLSQYSENEKRVKEFKDAPRKRRRTSPNELHILETEFARNNKPCKEEREKIAATMGMDEKAVQVWFQNKRQSCRRQQSGSNGSAASRTQSLPMISTNQTFQDENAAHMLTRAPLPPPPPFTSKPAFAVQTQGSAQPAKRAKSLRLTMSADGKAELVERSPLKPLHHQNRPAQQMQFPQFTPVPNLAMRFASMPLSGMETECATSLLFLKSGHWP